MSERKHTVLDLFCGCGGLSYGFLAADFDVVLGVDHWKDAIASYEFNHNKSKGLVADLLHADPVEISKITGIHQVDVIVGGPPCQGFSIAGKRIIEDERNELYKSFVKFVDFYRPKMFLMENVPNIISMGNGVVKDRILGDFQRLGYTVVYKVLMSSQYGVPQNRKRAFFIGMKDITFVFPEPLLQGSITSEDAISDLPENSVQNGSSYTSYPRSKYQEQMRAGSVGVYSHEITAHKDQTIEIISMVPDGGNYKNLPESLHHTRKVNIAWTRLNSKKPSFTIDTGHRHHFHYKFNRIPTVRESARIQSFPDSFIFLGTKTSQYKQVGNAVPPILAKILAESLKRYL